MAIDDEGEGQAVQHSLLERSADWHMSRALEHFVRVNPGVAENVEVLMVDKDLDEIKILQSYFPRAQVLICVFHVIKYLKLASRKPEFGKVSRDDHDNIDAVIHSMVYAMTKEAYNESHTTLREICTAVGLDGFFAYFEENWHSCINMWVMYTRLRLPHLRVHTNNHLESFFGHLKNTVKPTMGMAETVQALINDDRARANEYMHRRTKVGRHFSDNYDEDMNQLLKWTNPFVAKSVEGQYAQALEKLEMFNYNEDVQRGVVIVHGKSKAHEVNMKTWSCTCSFSCSIKLPCQHAIAYRKHKQYDDSIPLKAVSTRWIGGVHTEAILPPDRFKFTPFTLSQKKRKLTKEEKYREAVRATEVVCTELAGISDDDEFDEFLEFVLDQWRNVRQRKRTPVSAALIAEEDVLTQISQPHSLYSEEVGRVVLVKPVLSPAAGELIVHDSTSQPTQEARAYSDSDLQTSPRTARIALNPRAAKAGRPRLDLSQFASAERENRVIFNAAQQVWRETGEVTLVGLKDSLQEEMPSIDVTSKRLEGLVVKHEDAVRKRPKFVKLKNPVLNVTAFYLLPQQLLDKCFDVLPLANEWESAIRVFSQSEEQSRDGRDMGKVGRDMVECVEVDGLGVFSREQIEAMRFLANLKNACKQGEALLKRLRQDVPQTQFKVSPTDIANEIAAKYPDSDIPSLKGGYAFENLYRIHPDRWLSDAFLCALCERACTDFAQARFLGIESRKPRRPRGKKGDLLEVTKMRIKNAALDKSAGVLILPVNIGNLHWTVVLIMAKRREILYYDLMGTANMLNALKDVADDVQEEVFDVLGAPAFSLTCVNSPRQFDGTSCGVFVCLKIMRTLDKTISNDVSPSGLARLRYRLLAYVLRGEAV